jgi:hypothetical protein
MNQRDKSALTSAYHSRRHFLIICITVSGGTISGRDHTLQVTSDFETCVLANPGSIK